MRKNKLYSVLLSVAVAFGLWMYVVTTVSQKDDRTYYNIPVVMEGEAILNERNLMITEKSAESVSLHLSGSRGELNKLSTSNNLTVKVDISNIKEPGENIRLQYTPVYPADVSSSAITVLSRNPAEIYISVDYRRTKEVPVIINWTGTRSENYIYDTENAVLDNPVITLAGPASVVDQIDHAQIDIDLSEQVESISQSFRYTLCDANGEPVDAEQILTSVEEVRLDMQIQRIQEMKLAVDVIYGGGATAQNSTISISPGTIRVSGGEAVLAELGDTYSIATINLADLDRNSNELTFPINLPEGVTNQTGVTEAKVIVSFTDLVSREFTIDQFQIINLPEGMEAEIINANLTVKVRGPVGQISKLTEEDIVVEVDFTNAEVGTATYKANIRFAEGFEGVGALKTNSVSAMVQLQGG